MTSTVNADTGAHEEVFTMRMASSLISKVAKAKQYADDPARIQFQDFTLAVRGDNDTHTVAFHQGEWTCSCRSFHDDGFCAHSMAVERVLGITIPAAFRLGEPFSSSGIHQSPLH
jgi:hypothetical protein